MPAGPGVRVDTAVEAGDRIPPEYDPLICKLIVHAPDRPAALRRLRRALDETEIGGVQTTLPFHRAMLVEPGFIDAAGLSTTWVEAHWDGPASRARAVRVASLAAGLAELGEAAAREMVGALSPAGPDGHGYAADPANRDGGIPAWRTAGRALATDRWPG
jgi:acetyl/propionyl-CoA carboxylase alpha subunit